MKQPFIILILFALVTSFGIYYVVNNNAQQVITYFPLDENASFEEAVTKLDFIKQDNSTSTIDWTSLSKSDPKLYLRQDVSLLFANGMLKGIRTKWLQNETDIKLEQKMKNKGDTLWQSISFHHGEVHGPEDLIKSIQKMTYDQLYVYDSNIDGLHAFHKPSNQSEQLEMKMLHNQRNQNTLKYWQSLMHHFSIESDNYHLIPLTELYQYQSKNFPKLSRARTDKIIGQLWEGLYKNYIIPITDSKEMKSSSYMPIILLDKQNTHLYVLFELNGKKERLIQKITPE
ncbi:hypothetical protein SAMN05216389_102400 [Oceanobacillus limi]|uniref:Uncharacterized protein n=1 Tax=Oceanobacillus limi TaxID=930131 RepID=A0A1H9ZPM2_9BACI|nr:hypothetical protein [Oceanobacillus limi]SES83708.1 hypothetical protein SAMN05216389_102400 [Oceanobacillus limi]